MTIAHPIPIPPPIHDTAPDEAAIARYFAERDARENARPWNDAADRAATGEYHDHAIRESYEEREEHRYP